MATVPVGWLAAMRRACSFAASGHGWEVVSRSSVCTAWFPNGSALTKRM